MIIFLSSLEILEKCRTPLKILCTLLLTSLSDGFIVDFYGDFGDAILLSLAILLTVLMYCLKLVFDRSKVTDQVPKVTESANLRVNTQA